MCLTVLPTSCSIEKWPEGAVFSIKTMGLINYLKETKAEMKHVSWPTGKQAAAYTTLVIVISVLTALMLGLFDEVLTYLLSFVFAA